jgi:hypothetical protein
MDKKKKEERQRAEMEIIDHLEEDNLPAITKILNKDILENSFLEEVIARIAVKDGNIKVLEALKKHGCNLRCTKASLLKESIGNKTKHSFNWLIEHGVHVYQENSIKALKVAAMQKNKESLLEIIDKTGVSIMIDDHWVARYFMERKDEEMLRLIYPLYKPDIWMSLSAKLESATARKIGRETTQTI